MSSFRHVMVIDDSSVDLFVAASLMEKNGFAECVIVLTKAHDALLYLLKHRYMPELLPEVIFCDIEMPVINGFSFAEEFAKLDDTIKQKCNLVFLSSSVLLKDFERSNTNPWIRKFISKPLTEGKLDVVRSTILKRRSIAA